jgi:hypothetical protein
MADVAVDRLTLRIAELPWLSGEQGSALGRLIAEGLGAAGPLRAGRLDRLKVAVAVGKPEDVPALAARAVEAIVAELSRVL